MKGISYKRHRFSPEVIRYAVYLYFRFTLSLRDVEELLAERGIEVSYETIRCWCAKFGPQIAAELKRRRPPPSPRWHLDEMVSKVRGKRMYLWKAVDDEGEILDMRLAPYRDVWVATRFIADLLIASPILPESVTTDGYQAYGGALRRLQLERLHRRGQLRDNNRVENSHLSIRRRERKMQGFRSQPTAQRFLSAFGPIYNTFNVQAHLVSRKTLRMMRQEALPAWRDVTAPEACKGVVYAGPRLT